MPHTVTSTLGTESFASIYDSMEGFLADNPSNAAILRRHIIVY